MMRVPFLDGDSDMKKLGSLFAAAACVGLLAGPAMAQSTAAPPMAKSMPMPKKAAKKPMHMAKGKLTCMDYAYQSQDQADCTAGKIKPPNWR
jgi:hypothetical protein